jgi:hypothetical protein
LHELANTTNEEAIVAGKAGLKAGAIGLIVMVVWTVIGRLVPALTSGVMAYVSIGISSLLYLGVGVLAGLFLASPRTLGKGATAGVIGGPIAAVGASILGVVILLIQVSSSGTVPGLNPEQAQVLAESNMDPVLLTSISSVCGVGLALILGAVLGAAGGAISAALKGD